MTTEISNLKLQKAILLEQVTEDPKSVQLLYDLGKKVYQIFVLEKEEREKTKNIFDES